MKDRVPRQIDIIVDEDDRGVAYWSVVFRVGGVGGVGVGGWGKGLFPSRCFASS